MRKIKQYWHDQRPPSQIAERMQAFQQFNPEWSYHVYDRESAAAYLESHYGHLIASAFLAIRLPAMMADVFRVGSVLAEGGLYVDAATICRAPVDSWLPTTSGLILLAKQDMNPSGLCCNGLVYSKAPGHPFLEVVWSRISSLILARRGACVWLDFGPGLYRQLLRNKAFRDDVAILSAADISDKFEFSSSSRLLPAADHWSVVERRLPSLYADHSTVKPSLLYWLWDRIRRQVFNLADELISLRGSR